MKSLIRFIQSKMNCCLSSMLFLGSFALALQSCQFDYATVPTPKQIRVGLSNVPNSGLGMFASQDIRRGSVIEHCPLVFMKTSEMTYDNPLWKYVFAATYKNTSYTSLAFGYCSMYNHSPNPNVHYRQDCGIMMQLIAIKHIRPDDEMFIDYGERYWEERLLLTNG